ncbi:proline dehydrogenase family protein [Metallumcola ferriviriculae]|uniref:proline dehydrogenase n=1 Tax=Metallumcola ferriviriculae TaxID=3039180 RepID=A0AAU0UMA4_9FIRM|nr:proline dehydrogenase family protein [Desulfitibacteraceae bacterium MK1]
MSVARSLVLGVTNNKVISSFANKHGLELGAKRFVAGETLETAIENVKILNSKGIIATLDHLGESILSLDRAAGAADEYIKTLEGIAQSKINSNVSLKLTQMGLDIDDNFCCSNVERIVSKARQLNNFVRIDMEDHGHLAATISIFKRLKENYPDNVGLVLQSYLYRTVADMKELSYLKANYRFVKGAYKEPKDVAYPNKEDVDDNLKNIIEQHLLEGNYAAIASHDEAIIDHTIRFTNGHNIPRSLFEFQMLFGISTNLQEKLAQDGYTVRCYVPYGKDWYPYFTRRLAERPANVMFILKNYFKH